jgi:transposase InsO family protein
VSSTGTSVSMLCRFAKVSKAGYYKWLKIISNKSKDYDDYLLVKEMFDRGKGKWGWRSIQMHLNQDRSITMNHKKIIRLKNKYHLITKIRRKNPYKAIMKKTKEHRTFENILNRNFSQQEPKKVFCTDITYLPYHGRMAYLSAVKDIATHEIVGWNLSHHLYMDIVFGTIESMKSNQSMQSFQNILIHSDQGFHYTSPEYVTMVKNLGLTQSMSRKGNCVDNAPMESFFGHFKDEVDYQSCQTFEELLAMVKEYMEYYNNRRPQWDLKKMTPVQYKEHLLAVAAGN